MIINRRESHRQAEKVAEEKERVSFYLFMSQKQQGEGNVSGDRPVSPSPPVVIEQLL